MSSRNVILGATRLLARPSSTQLIRVSSTCRSFVNPSVESKWDTIRVRPGPARTIYRTIFASNLVYIPLFLLLTLLIEKMIRDTWNFIWYERNKGWLKEDVIASWDAYRKANEEEEEEEEEEE